MKKMIDYEGFEKYLDHFEYNLKENRENGILIRFTEASPYDKVIIEYYDISLEKDGETLSFQYDQFNKSEIKLDQKYVGDVLLTIILQSLNQLEEQNENRDSNPI